MGDFLFGISVHLQKHLLALFGEKSMDKELTLVDKKIIDMVVKNIQYYKDYHVINSDLNFVAKEILGDVKDDIKEIVSLMLDQ